MQIPLELAGKWIEKLAKLFSKLGEKRDFEVNKVAEELMVVPRDLVPVFIEPNIQQFSPIDEDMDEDAAFKTPLYSWMQAFIESSKTESDGRRQLFLLGDAGMGKTSVLAMLKLAHLKNFLRSTYRCEVMKLSGDSLWRIKDMLHKQDTVLLLDSLDEDVDGFGRISERIHELLVATEDFYRVIITCRTQFFPVTEEPGYIRQDRIKIGEYKCPVKYLSLFDENQVESYLNKKFSEEKETISKAKKVIGMLDDLKFRPLILTYVEDLIGETSLNNSYQVYETIVASWLSRESRKKHVKFDSVELSDACLQLADYMYKKGARKISEDELRSVITYPSVREGLSHVDVGGRSLLNRNSDGEYLFSHQSFLEFLVVKLFKTGKAKKWDYRTATDMMARFIRDADMSNLSLVDIGLTNVNIIGSNFTNSDLTGVIGYHAIGSGSNFTGARLDGAVFIGAKLIGAKFVESRGNVVNFGNAKLSESNFNRAELYSANFCGADLTRCSFKGAILKDAIFKDMNIKTVDFSGADLTGCKFDNVKIESANIEGARMDKSLMATIERSMVSPKKK